jgi:hypothetical protein
LSTRDVPFEPLPLHAPIGSLVQPTIFELPVFLIQRRKTKERERERER